MGPSFWQLLIILVIVLLLFGTKRLSNLGSDLGGAIKGFKKAMGDEENKSNANQQPPQQQVENKSGSEVIDVTPEKKKDEV